MSSDYWLVSEAVPFFTRRLSAGHEVSLIHGARMFQILFASGWEPTQLHFSVIPEHAWKRHEAEALKVRRPAVTFECLPLQTRLPEKASIPDCPEDSVIPVRFFVEGKSYMIPLISEEPESRNNGRYYLDIQFDMECSDGPYLDPSGKCPQGEADGEQLCKDILPTFSDEHDDFDDCLREFLFDKLSVAAKRLGSESLYRAWEGYLKVLEGDDMREAMFKAELQKIFERARSYKDERVSSALQAAYIALGAQMESETDEGAWSRFLHKMERRLDELILEARANPVQTDTRTAEISW